MITAAWVQPAESVVLGGDVDHHIHRCDLMPLGRAGKGCKKHLVGRNVDQLIGFGIIEMMVMLGVGVEHAVFVVNRHPPKKAGLGELVQRVVHGATSHMHAGVADFTGQPVCGHMAMPSVKQKTGDGQPLARRPQPGVAKTLHKPRFLSLGGDRVIGRIHSDQKMRACYKIVNNPLASDAVSCFLWGPADRVGRGFLDPRQGAKQHRKGAMCATCRHAPATILPQPFWGPFQMPPLQQTAFSYDDLIACAKGEMFGPGNPQLPMPPMLMCDRITEISADGGPHGKGHIVSEFDIKPDLWFFPCHFEGDPVMPGCLGMDALWQLVGFFLGWSGGEGRGRALSVGEVKFTGQILPANKLVRYEIEMKRVIMRRLVMGIADGRVVCDGETVFEANDIRVGLFKPEEA